MTTLNATFDPFVGTLTTTDYGFVHFPGGGGVLREFLGGDVPLGP